MKYPHKYVGWLCDILESLEWKMSIIDILNTEKQYPGLIDDLSTETRIRRLVKDQVEAEGKDGGDDEVDGTGED